MSREYAKGFYILELLDCGQDVEIRMKIRENDFDLTKDQLTEYLKIETHKHQAYTE